MTIDADCLRWARLESLERLARSLGITPRPLRDEYAYRLVLERDILEAIEAQGVDAGQAVVTVGKR